MSDDRRPDALLVGCGRLGAAVGLRLAGLGHRVTGIRRRPELVAAPIVGLGADLTTEAPRLDGLEPGLLVVALTARPRTEAAYRATYVEGMLRALDAVADAGAPPRRAVLVSSSAVNGDSPDLVTEETPPDPRDAPARVLLEAERAFAERLPHGSVLRLSGLYGDARPRLAEEVLTGRLTDPHRWTNRIHRDDAASAVVHLLTAVADPLPLYLGTDDEPALRIDVAVHLARQLGVPVPVPADDGEPHGKRLSNALLRATGWSPRRPTFREGYAVVPDA